MARSRFPLEDKNLCVHNKSNVQENIVRLYKMLEHSHKFVNELEK
jgi:hypothetical protein